MAEVNGVNGANGQDVAELAPALQEKLNKVNNAVKDFQETFQQNFVRLALEQDDGESGGKGWLQAIAKAMGQALGDKAAHMVGLSNDISGLNGEAAKAVGQDGVATAEGESLARQANQKMTEFQATAQEYSILSNAFSTAIKGLGESMSSMAKK